MEETKQAETTASPNEETTSQTTAETTETALPNEVDNAVLLVEANAKIVQLQLERDNYEHGLKVARRKLKETEEVESEPFETSGLSREEIAQMVAQQVQEQLLASKETEAIKERDALVEKIAKENSELRLALKNRAPQIQTGSGSNQEKAEVNTGFWTPDQIAEMQKRGIDPNKVTENLKKAPKI